jgi:fatty acid elongase 3
MQIIQFIIDLFIVYFGSKCLLFIQELAAHEFIIAYSHFVYLYYPGLPLIGNCAGAESAAVFGCVLLSSYLGLFINFYIQTYKAPAKGGKKLVNGVANGSRFAGPFVFIVVVLISTLQQSGVKNVSLVKTTTI